MNHYQLSAIVLALFIFGITRDAESHNGRRLLIEVVDSKLQAQGVNTGPDDGAPAVRDYINSIHDHWGNVESLGIATATLPGFDISPSAATALTGLQIELSLAGVQRWRPTTPMPSALTVPVLEPLDPSQLITVQGPESSINSIDLGSLLLIEDVPMGGVNDLDLVYAVNDLPVGEIHVLAFVLQAVDPAGIQSNIQASDIIHVLLSPDGPDPISRLHHSSLFLERYMAQIPEPTTAAMLLILVVCRVRNFAWRFCRD